MKEGGISTQAIGQIGQVRFRELLCGHNHEQAAYNRLLLETHECVVAPTLGSIVPNWLLIVPRLSVVSFRQWQAITCMNPVWLVGEILSELEIEAEQAIWFEHGPSAEGSPVGCGIDHAHLHLLVDAPFSFDQMVSSAAKNSRVEWRRSTSWEAYDSISAESSYLVGGTPVEAVFAEHVESVGSQFYRRVVARLAGKPHQWNYRTHAHLENVRRTISAFNGRRALAAAL